MNRFRVSCVIPVYNGRPYVAAAIGSVLNQTSPPLEVIVVDDGSTDGTRNEVRRFGDQATYVHTDNAGVSAARNHGIRVSRGEFICFLDADDLLHEDKLRRQLPLLWTRPELDLCDCHTRYFWSAELAPSVREADPRYDHDFWKQVTHGHISTWLVRREVFDRIGGFDEKLCFSEDTDWYLRLRDSGGITATLPDVLTYRRLHRHNITSENRADQIRALARVFKASLDRRRGMSQT